MFLSHEDDWRTAMHQGLAGLSCDQSVAVMPWAVVSSGHGVVLSTIFTLYRGEGRIEFVATHGFEKSARKLLTEEDRRELELLLLKEPRRGQVIERTGGFRKMRFARPSRREGKSGGARVIYYSLNRRDRIYLLLVYAKGVKDDLTRAEENQLRKLAKALEEEP